MKKTLLCAILALVSISAFSWGRHGHDAIAYIAECNLSPKALKTISGYLDGKSIVYWASWPDEVRTTEKYGYTTKWHVAYYDENNKALLGKNFNTDPAPDCLLQLLNMTEKLKDHKNMEKAEVLDLIRFIVHFVGDYHCPVHVKYANVNHNFSVSFLGEGPIKYHTLWDDAMISNIHQWSYMEYGHQLNRLSKKEIREVQKGWLIEWGEQSARDCRIIYEWAHPNDELGKPFYLEARPLADRQIQLAGYRLAKVLNEIFG